MLPGPSPFFTSSVFRLLLVMFHEWIKIRSGNYGTEREKRVGMGRERKDGGSKYRH